MYKIWKAQIFLHSVIVYKCNKGVPNPILILFNPSKYKPKGQTLRLWRKVNEPDRQSELNESYWVKNLKIVQLQEATMFASNVKINISKKENL